MNRIGLTKTVMMISNWKNHGFYKKNQRFKGLEVWEIKSIFRNEKDAFMNILSVRGSTLDL